MAGGRSLAATVMLFLLSMSAHVAHSQWGGAFMGEQQRHEEGAGQQQKAFTSGNIWEHGGQSSPQRPDGSMPNSDADQYRDKWLPTGRPGFDVPEDIKKMMEAARTAKPTAKSDFRGNTGFVNKMDPKTGTPVDEDDDEEEEESYIPKSSPGRKDEGRRIDKCLRRVAPFCSLRVMQENFAAFNGCVFDMRYRVTEECRTWAEGHGPCATDMLHFCNKMSPADTTECIKKHKPRMSRMCVDSPFFVSMEEGFQEFRDGMKEGMQGDPQGPPRYAGPQSGEDEPTQSSGSKTTGGARTAEAKPTIVRVVPKKVVNEPKDEF